MRHSKILISLLLGTVMLGGGAAGAETQGEQDQSQVVKNPDKTDVTGAGDKTRFEDSYEPKGIEMGSFLLFPEIETSGSWTSNVYASRFSAKPDFYTTVTPKARLQSRFDRHSLNVYASMERVDYQTYTKDSHNNFNLASDGRLEISQDTEATFHAEGVMGHEDRGAPTAVAGAVKPTPYNSLSGDAGLSHTLNRLTFGGTAAVARLTYENVDDISGTQNNNKARNRTEVTVTERAAYQFMPGYSWVVQLAENQRTYDTTGSNGISRDSQGYRVETGLGLDISKLVKGDLLAGYMSQTYKDSSYGEVAGYALKATLNWTPTEKLLVVPSAERSVRETTKAGASSMVDTTVSVLVREEVRRNLVATAYVGMSYDEFEGLKRETTTSTGRVALTYAFAPELYVGGDLTHKYKVAAQGEGFTQTVAMARLGLRW